MASCLQLNTPAIVVHVAESSTGRPSLASGSLSLALPVSFFFFLLSYHLAVNETFHLNQVLKVLPMGKSTKLPSGRHFSFLFHSFTNSSCLKILKFCLCNCKSTFVWFLFLIWWHSLNQLRKFVRCFSFIFWHFAF